MCLVGQQRQCLLGDLRDVLTTVCSCGILDIIVGGGKDGFLLLGIGIAVGYPEGDFDEHHNTTTIIGALGNERKEAKRQGYILGAEVKVPVWGGGNVCVALDIFDSIITTSRMKR